MGEWGVWGGILTGTVINSSHAQKLTASCLARCAKGLVCVFVIHFADMMLRIQLQAEFAD